MQWTQKQGEAINKRNSNLLVAAAAGSGKTAVLVERIKQLVIEDKIPIDEILVLTFTKAAASEMKEKIVEALNKELVEGGEKSKLAREQLDRIYKSSISTFHSFAMDIVRKYFHLIDIDPSIKICDETESILMKNQAIEQVFEDYFEEDNLDFKAFLDCYSSSKNDNNIKKTIIEIYERMQSMVEPMDWLEEKVEFLNISLEDFNESLVMEFLRIFAIETIEKAIEHFEKAGQLLEEKGLNKLVEKNNEDIGKLKELLTLKDFNEYVERLKSISYATLSVGKAEKEVYSHIKEKVQSIRKSGKDSIKKLIESIFIDDIETQLNMVNDTYKYGQSLYEILKKFDEFYKEAKLEQNLADFNDIEHYAIDIFKHENAAIECREKFKYIFIDEYQDSNILQEEIISKIARQDNLFMVGDIKQSIYRFRLAEPEIFNNKYLLYSKEDGLGFKIDLNQNFRSKVNIIESVNSIFEPIMDYDENAALNKGLNHVDEVDYPTELHLVDGMKNEGNLDEALIEMKNQELEALAAVKVIKDSIGKPIFDHKKGEKRLLELKDIVVLFRNIKNYGDIFYNVFSDNDLPTYIDDSKGYFDSIEILSFIDLLKIIDNKKQDIPLISLLRSGIFNFKIDELIEIRLNNKESSYLEAISEYVESGEDGELKLRLENFLNKISLWKDLSRFLTIDEFIWQLITDTGYYSYVGALPNGVQRQGNLRTLVDKAVDFAEKGDSTIFGFLSYIENMKNKTIEVGQATILGENDNIIRLMTIHKSKGLEFPMVLVAGLGRKFSRPSTGKIGSLDKDLGLGLSYVDYEKNWSRKTLIERVIEFKKAKEELEEDIRVLYVAFTRAMDKLVLLASLRDLKKQMDKYEDGVASESSYLDLIYPTIKENNIQIFEHNRSSLNQYLKKDYEIAHDIYREIDEYKDKENRRMKEQVDSILSYEYPYKEQLSIKSKFSVSELNKEDETSFQLNSPDFFVKEMHVDNVTKGTIMHTVMENLDFKDFFHTPEEKREEYLQTLVDKLIEMDFLLKEEKPYIEFHKIIKFMESPIGERAALSDRVYKETPFNLIYKLNENNNKIIVQGIIDCYFEEEGSLVLLDYKNTYAKNNIKKAYAEQIEIYKKALEESTGKKVKEAYLYLFSENSLISMA